MGSATSSNSRATLWKTKQKFHHYGLLPIFSSIIGAARSFSSHARVSRVVLRATLAMLRLSQPKVDRRILLALSTLPSVAACLTYCRAVRITKMGLGIWKGTKMKTRFKFGSFKRAFGRHLPLASVLHVMLLVIDLLPCLVK